MFKIEIEDDYGNWSDVCDTQGKALTFPNENEARAKLLQLHPTLVQMEKYGGGKRTRVVKIFRTDEEWKEGVPPRAS